MPTLELLPDRSLSRALDTHIPLPRALLDGINLYGYVPTTWICAVFAVLYASSTLTHFGQAIHYRKRGIKFMFLTAFLCGIIDTVGWGARLVSSTGGRETLFIPWLVQYLTTFVAPTPLLATDFVVFGRLIRELGEDYSWLRPRMYSILFLSFDILAILIQVGGGAISGTAAGNGEDPTTGSNIMLGGIIFQMVAMVIFMLAVAEYSWRYFSDRPVRKPKNVESFYAGRRRGEFTWNRKMVLWLVVVTIILLFIRGIYRLVEFIDGWGGTIHHNETLLNVLDGVPILLVLVLWNIGHPGRLLQAQGDQAGTPEKFSLVAQGSPAQGTIENDSQTPFLDGASSRMR